MRHCFAKPMAALAAFATALLPVTPAYAGPHDFPTKTPVKHVVVIFQENVSFDHYFGTYPHAFNLPGETPFHAKEGTRNPTRSFLPASSPTIRTKPIPFEFRRTCRLLATKITTTATNKQQQMAG